VTSALSGQRSNRLSYRPASRGLNPGEITALCACLPNRFRPGSLTILLSPGRFGSRGQSSEASVTSRPPSRVAEMLYRNEPRVARAVMISTSAQASRVVKPITLPVLM
jgi:hypothetical protein